LDEQRTEFGNGFVCMKESLCGKINEMSSSRQHPGTVIHDDKTKT